MMGRSMRLGLGVALGTVLLAGSAWAQQATPAAARGDLHVLGLRAPDGDDDFAAAMSTALRTAAGSQNYTVQQNSPTLDQQLASLDNCTSDTPDCLTRVGTNLSVPRFLYGEVTRVGRGATARFTVRVSLWDQGTRREVRRELNDRLSRADTRNEQRLQELAREMLTNLAEADDRTRAEAAAAAAAAAANNNNNSGDLTSSAPVIRLPPPPPQRTPVMRYVGYGLMGLGVVVGAVGVVQWIGTSSDASDASAATPTSEGNFGAWARFQGEYNPTGSLSASDVCARAQGVTSGPRAADARSVVDLCDSNSTAQAMALGFGIGGVVLAGVGAVLVVLDRPRGERAPNGNGPATSPTSRVQFAPVLGARTGGLNLSVTF